MNIFQLDEKAPRTTSTSDPPSDIMHQKSPSSPEETLHVQAVKPVFTTLNIPSITVPNLSSSKVKVLRTVKNIGRPLTYIVRVNSPEGIYVAVKQTSLNFTKFGEQKT
ncbi:hypothetical protein YC2023_089362 [Brassica napus]